MKYLRFYLDRNCVIMPGYGKTKNTRKGCGSWTWWDTKQNTRMLTGNAKVRNGTGGLLVVDVDPKNGGSVESLRQRFPDLPDTRAVLTVTQHPAGPGFHLIFTIPGDLAVATNRPLGTGIDVPVDAMLPGSIFRDDDGVDRMYSLANDIEPAPAPLALIAAVDKGQASDDSPSLGPGESAGVLAALLRKWADAGAGERNAVFTEVAIPILRAAGNEGADMLRYSYSGDDDAWLEQAIDSAAKKAGTSIAPMYRLRSKYVEEFLRLATQDARYGQWPYSSDRKVMFAVVWTCSSANRTTTPPVSLRDLSLLTGTETKTVRQAISRLIESARLHVLRTAEDGPREYTPIVGEMTTVSSKGVTPIRGLLIDPLHEVWLSDGLTGRHSHVFDLVDCGIRKASQIAAAGGMSPYTARDALKVLVSAGLLDKEGTGYSVPEDVVEIAHNLAMERGGLERSIRLADRISEERARPRGDAVPDDLDDDHRRRREDEELMRQLGIV